MWITYGVRAAEVVERLAAERIRVTPAEVFCVGSEPVPQVIRVCFSAARDCDVLADSLARIRRALTRPAPRLWQTI